MEFSSSTIVSAVDNGMLSHTASGDHVDRFSRNHFFRVCISDYLFRSLSKTHQAKMVEGTAVWNNRLMDISYIFKASFYDLILFYLWLFHVIPVRLKTSLTKMLSFDYPNPPPALCIYVFPVQKCSLYTSVLLSRSLTHTLRKSLSLISQALRLYFLLTERKTR